MTIDDVLHLRPRFWNFHRDLIGSRDSAAYTILTIHWNLCIGTIARFLESRPDLSKLLADLEAFHIRGEFMLTELDHGLDARCIETMATLLPDGTFDLHTPHPGASKAMQSSTPQLETTRVAVVFARLVVDEEDYGVKPFIVYLNEFNQMCPGILSQQLPRRPGARPMDNATTSFNHVRLGPGALLGKLEKTSPLTERTEFSNTSSALRLQRSLYLWAAFLS